MFVDSGFMLAFLRDTNNAASVTAAFKQINTILNEIGEISFGELFTVLLTDNGSEFSDPVEIEKMGHKTHPCNVFYCDPCNSNQKSQIERNHEFIRKILPKGTSETVSSRLSVIFAFSASASICIAAIMPIF